MNEHQLRAIRCRWTANLVTGLAVVALLAAAALLDAGRELDTAAPAVVVK